MADYKVTWFYGQNQTGWSETWHTTAASVSILATKIEILSASRAALLFPNQECDGIRVSELGTGYKSRLFVAGDFQYLNDTDKFKVPARGNYTDTGVGSGPDQPKASMQYQLIKGGLRISTRYLAGPPDAVLNGQPGGIDLNRHSDYQSKWVDFITKVRNQGFGIYAKKKEGTFHEQLIEDWVLSSASGGILGVKISNILAAQFRKGERVQVRGVKMKSRGSRPYNGVFYIDDVVTTTGSVATTIFLRGTEGKDPRNVKFPGKIQPLGREIVVPDFISVYKAGFHKRGKRFFAPVGRVTKVKYDD